MLSSRRSPRHASPSPESRASSCISTAAAERWSAAARIAAGKWPRARRGTQTCLCGKDGAHLDKPTRIPLTSR
eukprot:4382084-Prymnesium_polylepis.1